MGKRIYGIVMRTGWRMMLKNTIKVIILRWTKCERANKRGGGGGGGGSGEKIENFIFTSVYWGEKISLNSFSLPFIEERK